MWKVGHIYMSKIDVKFACYENLCMYIINHMWKVGHIYMSKIDVKIHACT